MEYTSFMNVSDYVYFYHAMGKRRHEIYPFTTDFAVVVVCVDGFAKGTVDLRESEISRGDVSVFLPGQILECSETSPSFECYVALFTKKFLDEFRLPDYVPSVTTIMRLTLVKHLSEQEMEAMKYYVMAVKSVSGERHPNTLQIVHHLTAAMFYLLIRDLNPASEVNIKSKPHILVDTFLSNLQKYHKQERSVGFYARLANVSSKHLSQTLRKYTNHTAGEWIDSFVIQEAKAMLKSTDKTIQQIAYELHFPNQSFFGKYFKRLEGVSPKVYRGD